VDLLGLVLYGLPLPILVVCIVLLLRLTISQQKEARLALKWRDLDPVRKVVGGLILVWAFLNLYLSVGDELALLNVIALPFSWIYSTARPIPIWSLTTTIVGLVVFYQLRLPKRPVVA
jgi:hypothetical protein